MLKRSIIGIIAIVVIASCLIAWIFSSVDDRAAADQARTESDFTTQPFVVSEIWESQHKEAGRVLSSYIFFKVKDEPISLRLPLDGLNASRDEVLRRIGSGEVVQAKVLKARLADARQAGFGKSVSRFVMGDKREVGIFELSVRGERVVSKSVNGWDDVDVSVLRRLVDQPFLVLIAFIPLVAVAGFVQRRKAAKAARQR